jgi:DNA-binding transcriptional MerR regulator
MPVSSEHPQSSATEEHYGINAVSRLTGISAHTLRIWERRHGVVDPGRTQTRRRNYSQDDIRRLTLIKALTDLGHKLPNLAALTTDALAGRLRDAAAIAPSGPVRVAFVGGLAIESLREAVAEDSTLRLAGEFPDLDSLEATLRPGSVDLIVMEFPALFPESISRFQSAMSLLGARRAVAIYHFAPQTTLKFLVSKAPGIHAVRAPVSAGELRLVLLSDVPASVSVPSGDGGKEKTSESRIPTRRYSDAQLANATRLSSTVKCECPQHLATLVASLAAFERYSSECENRNEQDARLHAHLHRATAECRAKMEDALGQLLEMEGVTLEG